MTHNEQWLLLLIRYAEGLLSFEEQQHLEQQLAADRLLQKKLAWVREAGSDAGSEVLNSDSDSQFRLNKKIEPEWISGFAEEKLNLKRSIQFEAKCWKSKSLTREVISFVRFQAMATTEADKTDSVFSPEKLLGIAIGSGENSNAQKSSAQTRSLPFDLTDTTPADSLQTTRMIVERQETNLQKETRRRSNLRWTSVAVAAAAVILVIVSIAVWNFGNPGNELTHPNPSGTGTRVKESISDPDSKSPSKDQNIHDGSKENLADSKGGKLPTQEHQPNSPNEIVQNDTDRDSKDPNQNSRGPKLPGKGSDGAKIVDQGQSPIPKVEKIPAGMVRVAWNKNRVRGVAAFESITGNWIGINAESFHSSGTGCIGNHFVTIQDSWCEGKVEGLGRIYLDSQSDLTLRPTPGAEHSYDVDLLNGGFALDGISAGTIFNIRFHQHQIQLAVESDRSAIAIQWAKFGFMTQVFRGDASGTFVQSNGRKTPIEWESGKNLAWHLTPQGAKQQTMRHNSFSQVITISKQRSVISGIQASQIRKSTDVLATLEKMVESAEEREREYGVVGLLCMGDMEQFKKSIKSKDSIRREAAMGWLYSFPGQSPCMESGWTAVAAVSDKRTVEVAKSFAVQSLSGIPRPDPKSLVMAQVLVNGMRSNNLAVREVCHYSLTKRFNIDSDFDVGAPVRSRRKSLESFKSKLAKAIPRNSTLVPAPHHPNNSMGAGNGQKEKNKKQR